MDNLKTKTVRGIAWSIVDQVFNLVTTLVITVFLARLIEPSEFGLLAMVTVMVGFLQIFRDFGLGAALIQKKDINDREINSVFWLNTFIGMLIGAVIFLSASYIAAFYHEPRLTRITQAMAGIFAIGSLGIVPDALIRKGIDFKEIFLRNAIVVILSGVIAIYLAYRGYGVWALVAQRLVLTIANVGVSFMIIKWFPKLHFHPRNLRYFIRFSLPLFGEESMNYWVRNIDNLSIGKWLGDEALGYYTRAYSLMLLPVRQLSGAISRVLFPAFSIIKDDKERVWKNYLKLLGVTSFVTFPLMGIFFVLSDEIIGLLFGEKWLPAAPIFRGLSFLGAVQSIAVFSGSIFNSQGKTALAFRIGLFTKPLMIAGILTGLFTYGIPGLITGYTLTGLISFGLESYYISGLFGKRLPDFFRAVYREMIISLSVTGGIYYTNVLLNWEGWTKIVATIAMGGIIYLAFNALWKTTGYRYILNQIKKWRKAS